MKSKARKMFHLSEGQVSTLRQRVFNLLENRGARLDHPLVLRKLAAAGAVVDVEKKIVRFPPDFLEACLDRAPGEFDLAGEEGHLDRALPAADGTFLVRPCTGAPFYLDPEAGEKRDVTLADVAHWAGLADRLDGIDFTPFPSPSDVPPQTADIHALRTMLEHTGKHVWVQPYSAESIPFLLELGALAAGGRERLRERPRVSFITCSLTPLDFKFMDLEVMVHACPLGVPVHACSLPGAGTTAPITLPGVVLLAAAEILVMLAVAQTLQPGAPVVGTPLIFAADMATGSSVQSSVEAIRGKGTAVEFVREAFGIPTHTYGWGTDGPSVGGQSVIESSLLGAIVAGAGCDILGGAGQLEVATVISPVQLVIDEHVGRMLKRMAGALELDDDTLAWEDLMGISPGGQFLTREHTLRHCRDAFRSELFTRDTRADWERKGSTELFARALDRYREIAREEPRRQADPALVGELERVVREADESLAS